MSPEATTEAPAPTVEAGATGDMAAAGSPGTTAAEGPGAPQAGAPSGGEAGAAGQAPTEVDFPEIASPGTLEETRSDPERNIELLRDVTLRVKVELGRGKMFLRDVLRLVEGSVVELEKLAGDPLDIYVNDRLVGKGEVLVLNENFCVRITQIFSPEECLRIKGIA